ncbi:MAG TPA: LacI family DNA-binding transcriptional regulator [bacterium]|nr:LacI family DNA-binding transcriptional regulator [bacterium]
MAKDYPTVKDIARELGLHHSTVSRALRDYPDISEATKEKVKKAARRMNYSPNIVAQSLKTKKTKLVGIIVPEIIHDFFSKAISGIENVVYNHGYVPIVLQSNESSSREELNVDAMITNRVAGLIVSISQDTESSQHFQRFIEKGIPLVFFDRVIQGLKAGYVISDDEQGSFQGAQYLIDKGYKKIAYFSGPKNLTICKNRLRGFKNALKKNDIALDTNLIFHGSLHEENGYQTIEKLIGKNDIPEAIFAVNDPVAMGAYKKIKEAGLKIPEDIAVLGFSNNEVSSYLDPALSTIDQFPAEMGEKAAQILFTRMQKENPDEEIQKMRTELIERQTT